MKSSQLLLKNAKIYSLILIASWFLYRYLFGSLPEDFEEIVVKPLIWLTPVFYLMSLEGKSIKSIGYTTKNLFSSIYFILALGAGFALEGLIVNIVKYSGINFSANIGDASFMVIFGISIITAITEETAFRGYLFTRLWKGTGNELKANLITSILWGIIHIPIVMSFGLTNMFGVFLYLGLIIIFGFGSAFVYARTKNIAASILLHLLWEWPILLFR